MEEKTRLIDSLPRKSSVTKSPFDPLEFWNMCRKDGTRQYSSVSKAKSRLIRHESSAHSPAEEDKTLLSIQKKLEALSTVQTSINQDLKLNPKNLSQISPPRVSSARRVRKGVIYRPTQRLKHNIFEFKNQHICHKCKVSWLSNINRKTCELCSLGFQGTAFEIELKMPTEENKNAVIVIGEKEIQVNANSRFKCIVTIPSSFAKKEVVERTKTFEIQLDNEWSEFTRVATPSFHLNTERLLENTQTSNGTSVVGEVSFSENMNSWSEFFKEIEETVSRKFNFGELIACGKVKESLEVALDEYSKLFKRIGGLAFSDLAIAIEKTSRGVFGFFQSCAAALMQSLEVIQGRALEWKASEAKYVAKIKSQMKVIQKYQETQNQVRSSAKGLKYIN